MVSTCTKEVEEAIDDLPGVVESAVFGVPHPDFGEAVVAAVVSAGVVVDEEAVLGALGDRLARFKQPKRCSSSTSCPATPAKVQKNVLRDQFGSTFAS